ncbi:Alpha-amylase [Dyella sp. AD56]|uniref:alpha-amylase family glycosyl hydrolase n=1 Tax=Dyella sp. AD56 TaxID=1528744 RepID=UPI000C826DA4|nr:alpha-amylase family glycosyl hydrolase [Dyella sp. AD56]PMQ03281.1 Alpha-amylase [Dyella sp. AD56]
MLPSTDKDLAAQASGVDLDLGEAGLSNQATKQGPVDEQRPQNASTWIRSHIESLLVTPCRDFDGVCSALRICENASTSGLSRDELRVLRLVRHTLFLLGEGATLFADCEFRWDSQLNCVLVIQRVFQCEDSLSKIFVKIAATALPPEPGASLQHTGEPSIILYCNPLRVIESSSQIDGQLGVDDLRELFYSKQKLKDSIRARRDEPGGAFQALMRRRSGEDKDLVRSTFELCVAGAPTGDGVADRLSHPYRGPQLLILPRLIDAADSQSKLAFIAESLALIRSYGFTGIMLAPVDKQSTELHYGETPSGQLIAHRNNHGYWCSGEVGIDPVLGTEKEYKHLVAKAASLGLSYTQDCTFATLGYLPQTSRLAVSKAAALPTMLTIGGKQVEPSDPLCFLHEFGVREENGLGEGVSASHYAEVLSRMHLGSSFSLPKPNLYAREVLDAVTERALWKTSQAGVRSFRIDMAKHISVTPLRRILNALRSAEKDAHLFVGNSTNPFSAILEYWTLRYRDLRFASLILGQENKGVYLYDFPLAGAIQDIFLKGHGFYATIRQLQDQRTHWSINLHQLIPVVIDHDFMFRPIYNGSQSTSAIVVAGHAMCLMLSANGPHVYLAYQDSSAGVPESDDYFAYSEQFSRKATAEIFARHDDLSPAKRIAELFTCFQERGVIEHWDDAKIDIQGDEDELNISRVYQDQKTGQRTVIRASFSRLSGFAGSREDQCDVLFSQTEAPSVLVWTCREI